MYNAPLARFLTAFPLAGCRRYALCADPPGMGPGMKTAAVEAAEEMWWSLGGSAYSLRESAGPRAGARPKRLKRATGAFLNGVSPLGSDPPGMGPDMKTAAVEAAEDLWWSLGGSNP